MYNVSSKNLTPLCILRVLEQYSDENHPLTQDDIIKHLMNDYGIDLERKAVGRTLAHFRDELEIDIESNEKGSWLAGRDFEPYELRLLIDSVMANKYVSFDDSKELVNKLCGLSNNYFKSHLKNVVVMEQANKVHNRDVYFNLEMIDEAIETNQDVKFDYIREIGSDAFSISHGAISPYCVLFMNQRYYLVTANPTVERFGYYALDRIKNIEIVERSDNKKTPRLDRNGKEKIRKIAETQKPSGIRQEKVRFYAGAFMIEDIRAAFGKDIIVMQGNGKYAADVTVTTNEIVFKQFMKAHLNSIEVISPQKYVDWFTLQIANANATLNKCEAAEIEEKDRKKLETLSIRTKAILGLPILFGKYPQMAKNKKTPIEWLPVEIADDKIMLISKDCLDYRRRAKGISIRAGFGVEGLDAFAWKDSLLREWLNGEFFVKAFSERERKAIIEDENGDKVSLIDIDHLRSPGYVSSCNIITMSNVAKAKWEQDEKKRQEMRAERTGIFPEEMERWLRDPGEGQPYIWGLYSDEETESCVIPYTEKSPLAMRVIPDAREGGVRPVIWLNA